MSSHTAGNWKWVLIRSVFRSARVSTGYIRWSVFPTCLVIIAFHEASLLWGWQQQGSCLSFLSFPSLDGNMSGHAVRQEHKSSMSLRCLLGIWAKAPYGSMSSQGTDGQRQLCLLLASLWFLFLFLGFFSQERTIWFWFWQTSETTASWEHEKCFQTLFKSYLRWNAAANCSWIEPAAWVTESWLHVAFRSNLFAAFKLRVETMWGSSITVKSDCWISKTNAFQRHTLSDDNELCLRAEQCVFILGRGWKIGRPLSPLEKYSISKHGYHPTQLSYVIHQRSTLILLMSTKYVLFGDLILSTTRSKPFLLARFLFLAFIDQPESCFFCLAMFSQLFDLFQS